MNSAEISRQLREVFVLLEFGNHQALQPFQLDNLEYNALNLLDCESGLRMVDLRARLLCDKSKVTRLIDRLERSGFVMRKASRKDRRSIRVHITPAGVKECDKAKPVIKRANAKIKSGFSRAEIEMFKRVLNSLFEKFRL